MPSNNLNIILNFTFKPSPSVIPIKGDGVVNYVVQDVAFRAGAKQRKQLAGNLQRDFAPIVQRELHQMARQVATMAIGINGTNTAPPGSLKITGSIAQSMVGKAGAMKISSVTGEWRSRSKAYLRWKSKTHRTQKWFKNSGELQTELGQASTYQQAYGPMAIRFIPIKGISAPTILDIGRSRGRPANTFITGRLEMAVFERLKISDLPGVGEQAGYSKKRLSGFADSIEQKLTGNNPKTNYRPLVEPFLTYYINRKIPNAVFRKLEQVISA